MIYLDLGFGDSIPVAAVIEKTISNALQYGECEYETPLPWVRDFFYLALFWVALWLGWEAGPADFEDDDLITGPFYGWDQFEYFGHKWLPVYWVI